jgi:hypothetical protein
MGNVLVAVVVGALLAFAAAHASILAGLLARRPRRRAVVALFLAPLAPWWGWQEGMRRRALVWLVSLGVYAVAVAVAAAR